MSATVAVNYYIYVRYVHIYDGYDHCMLIRLQAMKFNLYATWNDACNGGVTGLYSLYMNVVTFLLVD
jgi:hypothetical protein